MVKNLINALYTVLYMAPFVFIRFYPFRSKLRLPVPTLCVIYSILFTAQAALFCFLYNQVYWTVTLSQLARTGFAVFYALFALMFVRDNIFKQLYIWTVTAALSGVVFSIAHFTEARFFPAVSAALPHAVAVTVAAVLITVSFRLMLRLVNRIATVPIPIENSNIWRIVWIAPMLVDVSGILSTRRIAGDDFSHISYLLIGVLCFGSMIGFSLVLSETLRQMVENTRLTERAANTDAQLALQEDAYHMLKNQISETKASRHDLRHHLAVIQSYLQTQEIDRLQAYLAQYIQSLPADQELMLCENYSVNVIAAHFINMAQAIGIDVSVSLNVPENIGISDIDLCIVFSNCLENALEACKRMTNGKAYLKIKSERRGKMLVVLIENSFDGTLTYDDSDLLLSSKRNGNGIGISSVKAIVAKYNGVAKFEAVDHVFLVSLMMQEILNEEKLKADGNAISI